MLWLHNFATGNRDLCVLATPLWCVAINASLYDIQPLPGLGRDQYGAGGAALLRHLAFNSSRLSFLYQTLKVIFFIVQTR